MLLSSLQPYGIEILNYYARADDWHPATWFLSKEHRALVKSEPERIKIYQEKGVLLKKKEQTTDERSLC